MQTIKPDNSRIIKEAILIDLVLQKLYNKLAVVHSLITAKAILTEDGVLFTIDANSDKLLNKINEQIEFRKQQIISFYSNE